MKRDPARFIMGMSACLLIALVFSCGPPKKHMGTYISEGKSDLPAMSIELREDGKGQWKKGFEKFSFTWGMKGEELRLHLRDGGVLVGHVRKGELKISLPGEGEIIFRRKEG